jgi:Fms-interacting protein/Thoc5
MSPLKKRPFVVEAKDSVQSSPPLLSAESVNVYFSTLVEQIKASGRVVTDVQTVVLQLEEWQRQLYSTLADQEAKLEEQRAKRLKKQRKDMSMEYERTQLQNHITRFQNVAIPNLEKLARQETGNLEMSVNTDEAPALDIVSSFLGVDVKDPQNKSIVLAKLKEGFEKRASLEKDVQLKRVALAQTQQALKQKQDMIRNLPAQLAAIERASQLLGKFLTSKGKSSNNGFAGLDGSEGFHMAGTERLARLERAQQLPAPLYTLFSLLQRYIDEWTTAAANKSEFRKDSPTMAWDSVARDDARMKLSVVLSSAGASVDSVIWQLPVPEITASPISSSSSNKGKYVHIHFVYHSKPVPVVTTHVTGAAAVLNQETLLDELFPGDVELDLAPSCATGKSYQWSNHLAGLYQIPSVLSQEEIAAPKRASSNLHTSTRVVVQELQRRIRANATLKHILYSLQRLRVPAPPSFLLTDEQLDSHDSNWKPTSKLASFAVQPEIDAEMAAAKSGLTMYHLEIRHDTKSLFATVRIHAAQYPAVPPVWEFQTTKSEAASSPLYDGRLAQLTQQVNVDALNRGIVAPPTTKSPNQLTVDDVGTLYYEWILIHQLREIMLFWDTVSTAPGKDDSTRSFRGRDRRSS